MIREHLVEALNAHADSLVRGDDNGPQLLAAYPDDQGTLLPLLNLARLIKQTLVPVIPPSDFIRALGQELWAFDGGAAPRAGRRRALGAAAVGSLLSVAGVGLWLYRRRSPAQLV